MTEIIRLLTSSSESTSHQYSDHGALRGAYNVSAVCIFAVMAYTFFFPCNKLVPLDRRTVAVLCAILCYITRTFFFPHRSMKIVEAVDFDVLILLASIMAINHIVVHLKETRKVIEYLQKRIQDHPFQGFWMVSLAAFIVSPFLTNDGVCLLFVEPILKAFESTDKELDYELQSPETESMKLGFSFSTSISTLTSRMKLERMDSLYFMLTLACSSNIGSVLTYTGNPQNMIIANDAIFVMPSYLFSLYMLLPSILAWSLTTWMIQYCWISAKTQSQRLRINNSSEEVDIFINSNQIKNPMIETVSSQSYSSQRDITSSPISKSSSKQVSLCLDMSIIKVTSPRFDNTSSNNNNNNNNPLSPLTPRRRKARQLEERQVLINKIVYIVSSPFPYMILVLLLAMIILIFVDVMSISALVCISAIVMIVALVLGNHWRGRPIVMTEEEEKSPLRQPMTDEDKIDNMNEFFEGLFASLDYSLLFIFLGTFIVVANVDSTGIPKAVWDKIVGKTPFKSFRSVVGISLFILLASQFLGNVAIVQLAKPNVEDLAYMEKKYAWAMISFISTVGGNLTITGSAANIIVSEKSARIDPDSSLDFFHHLKVCFGVTLVSCILGGFLITLMIHLEN